MRAVDSAVKGVRAACAQQNGLETHGNVRRYWRIALEKGVDPGRFDDKHLRMQRVMALVENPQTDRAPDLVRQSPGAAQQGDPEAHRRRRDLPRRRAPLIRLVGAVLAEQHDEWAESRRYLGLDLLSKSRTIGEPTTEQAATPAALTA